MLRKSNMSSEALDKVIGAYPSTNSVATAIHKICDMVEQQIRVEAVLLEKLTYSSKASDLSAIVAFFKGVDIHRAVPNAPASLISAQNLLAKACTSSKDVTFDVEPVTSFGMCADTPQIDPSDFEMMAELVRDSADLK